MKIDIEFEVDDIDWEDNAYVKIEQPSKSLMEIQANKEGLISLAKQFLSLAYSEDEKFHIHHWAIKKGDSQSDYAYGDLEEGSLDLSVAKVKEQGR